MSVHTDVIIVGAGHNGLIAAAVLAKRGVRVTIVEERGMIGGATKTELTLHRFRGHPNWRAFSAITLST